MNKYFKTFLTLIIASTIFLVSSSWGFYAHRYINEMAIYTLPKEMYNFYSKHAKYLEDHSIDPDKRKRFIKGEGSKHFIDLDKYYQPNMPHPPFTWQEVTQLYDKKTIAKNGTLPWNLLNYLKRLTEAFKEKDANKIIKLSADIGHYIADACVPLHTSSNYNGQLTGQEGIHSFWESRLPELFTKTYNIKPKRAEYIKNPYNYIWNIIIDSHKLVDTVLNEEKELNKSFDPSKKYSPEKKGSRITVNYSEEYSEAYNKRLKGMVASRMQASIEALGSLWFTAWVNAGQPNLDELLQ